MGKWVLNNYPIFTILDFYSSSYQRVSSGDFEVFFNLCDNLPPEDCGEGLKICIRKKSDNTKYLFGNELQPGTYEIKIIQDKKK